MAGAAAGAEAVERAHGLYRGGRHREALELYSAALAAARGPAQRIALHSNRAACYLKLHDFHKCPGDEHHSGVEGLAHRTTDSCAHLKPPICDIIFPSGWHETVELKRLQELEPYLPGDNAPENEAAQECTSVLELDTEHAGALMLRAQTLVTLKDYQSALFDVNRLIEINPSSEVYRNLQARLKTQLSLAPIPECEEESLCLEEENEELPPKGQKNETSICNPDEPAIELSLKNKPSTGPVLARKPEPVKAEVPSTLPSKSHGWEAIPKPKGHSGLDYSKWDKVEDDSSEDDDDEEEDELPQYKFKVRTVGVRPVK